jgi:hypothetical protein
LRELEAMGKSVEPGLRRGLETAQSPRVISYVKDALQQLQDGDHSSLLIEAGSVLRSLAVLEQIGSPEARQVLEGLAKGPAASWLAREARATMDRLEKRPKSP